MCINITLRNIYFWDWHQTYLQDSIVNVKRALQIYNKVFKRCLLSSFVWYKQMLRHWSKSVFVLLIALSFCDWSQTVLTRSPVNTIWYFTLLLRDYVLDFERKKVLFSEIWIMFLEKRIIVWTTWGRILLNSVTYSYI